MKDDTKIIATGGGRGYTYGRDQFGEFGTIFAPEEDAEIPPPLDFEAGEDLARKIRDAETEVSSAGDLADE